MPKIPFMRRKDAVNLALEAAGQGWKRHKGKPGVSVEYWEKELPDGELNLVRSTSAFRDFDLQFVEIDGTPTKLGGARGSVEDAKVKAVLEASKRGISIFRPGRTENPAPKGRLHPGKLAALDRKMNFAEKGILLRPVRDQSAIVSACVSEYGYRSSLASVMALRNASSGADKGKAERLENYVVRAHGRQRPTNRISAEWEAIPAILMHVKPNLVRLTARQTSRLTSETTGE